MRHDSWHCSLSSLFFQVYFSLTHLQSLPFPVFGLSHKHPLTTIPPGPLKHRIALLSHETHDNAVLLFLMSYQVLSEHLYGYSCEVLSWVFDIASVISSSLKLLYLDA